MDVRHWQNPEKKTKGTVSFESSRFANPPKTFMALNWLDIDKAGKNRVWLSRNSSSGEQMEWNVESWADSKLYSARGAHIAITA